MSTFSQFFRAGGSGSGGSGSGDSVAVFLPSEKEDVGKDGIIYLKSGILKDADDYYMPSFVNNKGETWLQKEHTLNNVNNEPIKTQSLIGQLYATFQNQLHLVSYGIVQDPILTPNFGPNMKLAYAGTRYIMVNDDQCYISSNVVNLTAPTTFPNTGSTFTFTDIAGPIGAADESNPVILLNSSSLTSLASTSSSLEEWFEMTLPGDNSTWNSIAYGNGKYIAVSDIIPNDKAAFCDGVTWSTITLPAVKTWKKVCFIENKFFIIDNTNIVYFSVDLISWERVLLPVDIIVESVSYCTGYRYILFICKNNVTLLCDCAFAVFTGVAHEFESTVRSTVKMPDILPIDPNDPYSNGIMPLVGGFSGAESNVFYIFTNFNHYYKSINTVGSIKHTPNLYFKVGTYDINDVESPYYVDLNT